METAPLKTYATLEPMDESALDPNSSYAKILGMIDGQVKVLDFGCGPGNLARFLSQRGCSVIGVDINPEHAGLAREYCDEVVVADLDSASLLELFPSQRFDVVIFADIFEHLRHPERMLAEVPRILRPDGFVIASIPNVAHGAVRLALLNGHFDYQPLGILDSTHLRFFTRKTMLGFFDNAGFVVDETVRTTAPIFDPSGTLVPAVDPSSVSETVLASLQGDPDAETLQFIVKALPKTSSHVRSGARRKIAILENRVRDLERELSAANATIEADADRPSKQHFDNVLERLHAATTELETLRSADERAKALAAQIDELSSEHASAQGKLGREIEHLTAALEISGTEQSRVQDLLLSATEALEFERSRTVQQGRQVDTLEKMLHQQIAQLSSVTEERDILASQLRQLNAHVQQLEASWQAAQDKETDAEALTALATEHEIAVSALRHEIMQLTLALELAESARSEKQALLDRTSEALDFERSRNEGLERQFEATQKILHQQVEQLNIVAQERDVLTAQVHRLREDLQTVQDCLDASLSAQESLESARRMLEGEVEATRQSYIDAKREAEARVADLQSHIEMMMSEMHVLRVEHREMSERYGHAEFCIENMRKSKFWQIRNSWFRVKAFFGVRTDLS